LVDLFFHERLLPLEKGQAAPVFKRRRKGVYLLSGPSTEKKGRKREEDPPLHFFDMFRGKKRGLLPFLLGEGQKGEKEEGSSLSFCP